MLAVSVATRFLYGLFNRLRIILFPLISRSKPQDDVSSQQPLSFEDTIRQSPAHKSIFGADGSTVFGKLIGAGASGWVFRISESKVLKVPRFIDYPGEDTSQNSCNYTKRQNDSILGSLTREKEIYKLLGDFDGVIKAWPTDAGIEFPYMPGGTIEEYMDTHESIDIDVRLNWIKSIVDIVRRVHQKRILINDFGLRNFLLDNNLSLVMIDFGTSEVIPDNIKFEDFVDYGFSEKGEVAAVGSLIYEIVTSKYYMVHVNLQAPFDVAESTSRHNGVDMWFPYWPPKEELADTTGILLGDIILQCWLKDGFQNMDQVCKAVAAKDI